MKKILITGADSYIGTNFEKWVGKYPEKYSVDTIDMKDGAWKEKDFAGYDVVFHVAGIAHVKETKKNEELYYRVNRDMAYEVAQKSKENRVKQFILLSSMSVYGIESGLIDRNSQLNPKSNYGKSKLQAEELIKPLGEDDFKVAILRPPMIYGYACKGNFATLSKLAKKIPLFPDIENHRSMIYIDNLNEFIRLLIEDGADGVFFPQNKEYVCTTEMVKAIVRANGKVIHTTKIFNPLISFTCKRVGIIRKIFGSLRYEHDMSGNYEYCICEFERSILTTENK